MYEKLAMKTLTRPPIRELMIAGWLANEIHLVSDVNQLAALDLVVTLSNPALELYLVQFWVIVQSRSNGMDDEVQEISLVVRINACLWEDDPIRRPCRQQAGTRVLEMIEKMTSSLAVAGG